MATSRICSIEGCGKPHLAKGFCDTHYRRLARTGDPTKVRKWGGWSLARVKKLMEIETDECVFLDGMKPYCNIQFEGVGRSLPNLVCRLAYGPPPTPVHEGAHSCGNGHMNCVNKRHLRWATPQENADDRGKHGRWHGNRKFAT